MRPAAVARELTKMFEETKSETLGELAAWYRDHETKGEIVILVGPAEKKAISIDVTAVDNLLRQNLHTHSLAMRSPP